jgi:TPR repeat protein
MVDHAPHYPSYSPDVAPYEPYEEKPTGHSIAPYEIGQSARANNRERSVPLFLSDRDGVPDPSEYMSSLSSPSRRRVSYYTSRILVGALGGVAVAFLAALASSDSARDIIASAKASTTAALFAASAAVQPNSTQPPAEPKIADAQLKEPALPAAPENQAPGAASVTVAAVMPTRDDIKTAYQGALQGGVPPTASVPEAAIQADAIRHLDASEIAALFRRADDLIASGDIAAARLVLRRAAEAGEARAAMMLGGTYDPAVLEKMGVHGVVPNLTLARSWYEKAKRFGASEATSQLETLAKKQN